MRYSDQVSARSAQLQETQLAFDNGNKTHREAILLHRMRQLVTFRSASAEEAVLTHVEAETLEASISTIILNKYPS